MQRLLPLFFITTLYANTLYPTFSQSEKNIIKKQYSGQSIARIDDYTQTLSHFASRNQRTQVIQVNTYLNGLLPQYDDTQYKKEDYWQTPKEFLIRGAGDCEDYAIIKYFSLIKLGVEKKKLYLTTVKEKFSGGSHMVLSYFEREKKSPLILDNLSFRVLDLQTREDLEPQLFINDSGVYKINTQNTLVKVGKSFPLFEDLLKRVQRGY